MCVRPTSRSLSLNSCGSTGNCPRVEPLKNKPIRPFKSDYVLMQQIGDPAAVDQKWINASMEIHFRRGGTKSEPYTESFSNQLFTMAPGKVSCYWAVWNLSSSNSSKHPKIQDSRYQIRTSGPPNSLRIYSSSQNLFIIRGSNMLIELSECTHTSQWTSKN